MNSISNAIRSCFTLKTSTERRLLWPLITINVVVAVDILGLMLLLPIIDTFSQSLGASKALIGTQFTVYSASAILSSLIIGRISDHFGRKTVFIISATGALLTSFGCIFITNFTEFLVMSTISGFCSGTVGTAYAYISDIVHEENLRAKYISYITATISCCLVIGPLLGGALSMISLRIPFIFSSLIACLELILVFVYLKNPAELYEHNKDDEKEEESIYDSLMSSEQLGSGPKRDVVTGKGSTFKSSIDVPESPTRYEFNSIGDESSGGENLVLRDSLLESWTSSQSSSTEDIESQSNTNILNCCSKRSKRSPNKVVEYDSPWTDPRALVIGGLGTFFNVFTYIGLICLIPLILQKARFNIVTDDDTETLKIAPILNRRLSAISRPSITPDYFQHDIFPQDKEILSEQHKITLYDTISTTISHTLNTLAYGDTSTRIDSLTTSSDGNEIPLFNSYANSNEEIVLYSIQIVPSQSSQSDAAFRSGSTQNDDLSSHEIKEISFYMGLFLGCYGLTQVIGMIFIFPNLNKSFGLFTTGIIGSIVFGLVFGVVYFVIFVDEFYLIYIFMGFANSLCRPIFPTYLSMIANKKRRAEYMALTTTFSNLALMIGGQLTWIYTYSNLLAILLCATASLLNALLLVIFSNVSTSSPSTSSAGYSSLPNSDPNSRSASQNNAGKQIFNESLDRDIVRESVDSQVTVNHLNPSASGFNPIYFSDIPTDHNRFSEEWNRESQETLDRETIVSPY